MAENTEYSTAGSPEQKSKDLLMQNLQLTFLSLLYNEPLYKFIGKTEQDMNILVIGWNTASEIFTDLCLEVAQMDKHPLNITVLCSNAGSALKGYLAADKRPALNMFVNVNDSIKNGDEPYANLDFLDASEIMPEKIYEKGSGFDDNMKSLLEPVINKPYKGRKYHYFLVSCDESKIDSSVKKSVEAGGDEFNRKIALTLEQLTGKRKPSDNTAIYYVTYLKERRLKDGRVKPVYINTERKITLSPELDRIAFNAHIVWNMSYLDQNYDKVYREFKKDSYNYNSSVAFAASVKYKLKDLDVELTDPYAAADEVYKKLRKGSETANSLIALEHRRWVIEKAIDGWCPPLKEELNEQQMYTYCKGCLERLDVKDGNHKIHECMVRSNAKNPLYGSEKYMSAAYWDGKGEPENMDELDLLSLRLHRGMRKSADDYVKSNPLENDESALRKLENTVTGTIRSKRSSGNVNIKKYADSLELQWNRYKFCIRNMLDKNRAYTQQYDTVYREDFLLEVEQNSLVSEDNKATIKHLVNTDIKKDLFPLIEANLYRDYKEYDRQLIYSLPFILTYRRNMTLAMPFKIAESSNNLSNTAFSNVASPTIIRPSKILYLVYIEKASVIPSMCDMIKNCVQYLADKRITGKLTFYINYKSGIVFSQDCFDFLDLIKEIKIEKVSEEVKDESEAAMNFALRLIEEKTDLYDGSNSPFSSALTNGEFYNMITENTGENTAGENCQMAYFEFDFKNKEFKHNDTCRYLHYINDESHLRIEDMFGLAGATDLEFNYQPFGECYRELWNIYTGKNRVGSYINESSPLLTAIEDWNAMCNGLEKFYDPKDANADMPQYNEEFPESLLKDIIVKEAGQSRWDRVKLILDELSKVQVDEVNVFGDWVVPQGTGRSRRFRFRNESVKKMMTKAGSALEICLYFEACAQGWFDEITGGYHFKWGNPSNLQSSESDIDLTISNEFDLVLTKGFRSFIVECKAREELNQDFYYKIDSLADTFGIAVKKILVTAANLPNEASTSMTRTQRNKLKINEMESERGNLMGIYTLFMNKSVPPTPPKVPALTAIVKELQKIAETDD